MEDRLERIEGVLEPAIPKNIGRKVNFAGHTWEIAGINYLGDYDLVRYEDREDGRVKIGSSCRFGLPFWHGHYAELVEPADQEWLEQRGWELIPPSPRNVEWSVDRRIWAICGSSVRIMVGVTNVAINPTRGWVERFEALLEEGGEG